MTDTNIVNLYLTDWTVKYLVRDNHAHRAFSNERGRPVRNGRRSGLTGGRLAECGMPSQPSQALVGSFVWNRATSSPSMGTFDRPVVTSSAIMAPVPGPSWKPCAEKPN